MAAVGRFGTAGIWELETAMAEAHGRGDLRGCHRLAWAIGRIGASRGLRDLALTTLAFAMVTIGRGDAATLRGLVGVLLRLGPTARELRLLDGVVRPAAGSSEEAVRLRELAFAAAMAEPEVERSAAAGGQPAATTVGRGDGPGGGGDAPAAGSATAGSGREGREPIDDDEVWGDSWW